MLTFYNAVANNGRMMRPMFVKEIRNKGQLVQEFKPSIIKDSIASPRTIKYVQQALEGVVVNGTAKNLLHTQYKVAGKTGTAQIANTAKGYKGDKIRYQASFVGYFPADNPRYSCMVVVYAPNNNLYYASQVAAPIFKEIADKVYSTNIELHKELRFEENLANNLPAVKAGSAKHTQVAVKGLGIPIRQTGGQGNWVAVNWSGESVEMKDVILKHDQVPSVIGMGLRDALYLLESRGLQVRTVGKGKVVKQSVTAGSKIEKGTMVTIQLG
jgi:cell division protein FtsI (penicillin-binding protein 3)